MWTIHTNWATNTISRNAFYQTFWIEDVKGGRHAGLLHYGRLTAEMNRERRPVLGGNTKLLASWISKIWVDTKFREKTQGDYVPDRMSPRYPCDNEAILRKTMTTMFGAELRDQLLTNLGLRVGPDASGEVDPSTVDDSVFIPDEVAHEPEIVRDERWGSW